MAKFTAQTLIKFFENQIQSQHSDWIFCNPCAETKRRNPDIFGQWVRPVKEPGKKREYVPVGPLGKQSPTGGQFTFGDLEACITQSKTVDEAVRKLYAHITGSKPISADPSIQAEAQSALLDELTTRIRELETVIKNMGTVTAARTSRVIQTVKDAAPELGVSQPESDLLEEAFTQAEGQKHSDSRWTVQRVLTDAEKQEFKAEFGVEPIMTSKGLIDKRQLKHLLSVARLSAAPDA